MMISSVLSRWSGGPSSRSWCSDPHNFYAIRTLRNHGLSGQRLWEVTQSTFLSRLYASQAWYGMLDANGKARLESTLQKAIKQGFLPQNHKTFAETCDVADQRLFRDVLMNPHDVLHIIYCHLSSQSTTQNFDHGPIIGKFPMMCMTICLLATTS